MSYRSDTSLPNSSWAPDVNGTIWLGTFNNLAKVREETCRLWAKVMHALPESKLFLKDKKAGDGTVRQRIESELSRHGIGSERIEFAMAIPDWRSHMALYDRLDIALDTIPLNSGTTAFDALWMGAPVVALEGDWFGGRMASTVLKALGRPEWVAQNEDEYVTLVSALARDVAGRKSLRAAQRSLMASSPLCDANGLARALEEAFEGMFDRWLANCEARSLTGAML
jgi:predicted O-linked N-acetylglucosamine transferase (SPINDLY family)